MSRLNNVSGRQAMRVAERNGWIWKRTNGDHYIYLRPGNPRNLAIPDHRELREGMLREIIHRMGMTVDEFLAALKS